jgi:hypothetical protein
VTDAELVVLAVAQAAIGISSDRQFLGLIGRVLPGWFPHLPDQSQYNRRLRGLVELISIVQQRLARCLDTGGVRLSDGTPIAVANDPSCAQRSEFAGFARSGFAKSTHRFVWNAPVFVDTWALGRHSPIWRRGCPAMPRGSNFQKPYPPEFRREAVAL